jgi:hypothetical protein
MGYVLVDNDEVVSDTIQLEEIIVSKEKLDPMLRNDFCFAKQSLYNLSVCQIGSERLTLLNKGMTRLSNRKKKYFKIVESYLSNESAKLKKIVAKSRANIGKANSSPNRHYDL